jgi:hypothetical protein
VLNDRKSLRVWDASESVLAFIDYQQHVFDVIFAQDRRAAGFIGYGGTSGASMQENYVHTMLVQLIAWGGALKALRKKQPLSAQ